MKQVLLCAAIIIAFVIIDFSSAGCPTAETNAKYKSLCCRQD
ncbi:MAG: hypothetical protein ABH878_08750 [bacterium]